MDELSRMFLPVTKRDALQFFFSGLYEVSDANVDKAEMLYVASILAHYAQVSCGSIFAQALVSDLTEIHDLLELGELGMQVPRSLITSEVLETAASQILLYAGFFRRRTQGRHNPRYFTTRAAQYFYSASVVYSSSGKLDERSRAGVLRGMAHHSAEWSERCARLQTHFAENRYRFL